MKNLGLLFYDVIFVILIFTTFMFINIIDSPVLQNWIAMIPGFFAILILVKCIKNHMQFYKLSHKE